MKRSEVERIRGLPFKNPVVWTRVTGEEMDRLLAAQLDKAASGEDWHRIETTLKAFDLIPPRSNLRHTLETLLSEQALAFYDPDSKRMVVGEPAQDGLSEIIEAFEGIRGERKDPKNEESENFKPS